MPNLESGTPSGTRANEQAGLVAPPALARYAWMFLTFARNSLIRDMTFRSNFVIEVLSSMSWMVMNLGFYALVFGLLEAGTEGAVGAASAAEQGGVGPGGVNIAEWEKHQFFVFIATTMFINSLVQALFMPNAQELSELVRTGGLDFALLKPIDTQFLVSMRKISWSSLGNFCVAGLVLAYALWNLEGEGPSPWAVVLYPMYIVAGVLILYSVMISLAATSIWLGRNQSLYDFWFYITNFSRYPMEIYGGSFLGEALRAVFTFAIPILLVINVPARIMAKPLSPEYAGLAVFAALATAASLYGSRWVFKQALESYRSASS